MTESSYIVVAVTTGDGPTDYGHRVWSQAFKNKQAAEACVKFIEKHSQVNVCMFSDISIPEIDE